MQASVIIPSYNGAKKLPNILAALEQQTVKDFEVIVVIDGSTDNTDEVLHTRAWQLELRIVRQQNKGRAATRNTGVAHARGDLLIFFDDDMRPLPECVAQHILFHQQHPNCMITGGVNEEISSNCTDMFRFKSHLSEKWLAPLKNKATKPLARSEVFATTQNLSVETAIFNTLGGFEERLSDAEDYELAVRAFQKDIPLYFEPSIFAWHDDPVTARSYIKRQRQYMLGQATLKAIHPEWISEKWIHNFDAPTGIKSAIFRLFCNRIWVDMIDRENLLWLPQKIRYRLYDYIITANGVFFPDKVRL